VKASLYPTFLASCTVILQLPDNKSTRPDLRVRVTTYINTWDDVHRNAVAECKYRLGLLGVTKETIDLAYFEIDDTRYTAVEPRGVRREYGVAVEAFYLHDPKKRDVLIRQRRLVPESMTEMMAIYGKATLDGGAA